MTLAEFFKKRNLPIKDLEIWPEATNVVVGFDPQKKSVVFLFDPQSDGHWKVLELNERKFKKLVNGLEQVRARLGAGEWTERMC